MLVIYFPMSSHCCCKVSLFFYALSVCLSLLFYPEGLTRTGTVSIAQSVCWCVWCVWVNSAVEACTHTWLMTWTSHQGGNRRSPDVCLIQTLCSRRVSSSPLVFSFSLSLSILLRAVSPPTSSLTPSLSSVSTECHRVSVWGVTYRSGILPLRRPAPHYSWQHRPCISVWEDPLQVLHVRLSNFAFSVIWYQDKLLIRLNTQQYMQHFVLKWIDFPITK